MLKKILAEFEQNTPALCLDELSQKLDVETGALEGMLQTLVRKGRLLEIDANGSACDICPVKSGCFLITGAQKSYVLTPLKNKTICRLEQNVE
jgi:hypothetical protein